MYVPEFSNVNTSGAPTGVLIACSCSWAVLAVQCTGALVDRHSHCIWSVVTLATVEPGNGDQVKDACNLEAL